MALQLALDLENGISLSEAYLIITRMNFMYSDMDSVEIYLSVYKDKDAYDAGKPEIFNQCHVCSGGLFEAYFSTAYLNMENKNHYDSAYEWLLSLEPYFDAVVV
jgi:hypothetical protein